MQSDDVCMVLQLVIDVHLQPSAEHDMMDTEQDLDIMISYEMHTVDQFAQFARTTGERAHQAQLRMVHHLRQRWAQHAAGIWSDLMRLDWHLHGLDAETLAESHRDRGWALHEFMRATSMTAGFWRANSDQRQRWGRQAVRILVEANNELVHWCEMQQTFQAPTALQSWWSTQPHNGRRITSFMLQREGTNAMHDLQHAQSRLAILHASMWDDTS